MNVMTTITGEITIPHHCFYTQTSLIKITLQDTSRVDRLPIDISRCWLQSDNGIYAGGKFHFALDYGSLSETPSPVFHQWYTLQVRIEDIKGSLLCFNHRVTRAIDDNGQPIQSIQIPLTSVLPREDITALLEEEPPASTMQALMDSRDIESWRQGNVQASVVLRTCM